MNIIADNPEQGEIFVKFKDYGFFVPKDISGKEVVLEGVAKSELLSEDEAKHYADDGGIAYDPAMRKQISLVAEGVILLD